MSSAVVGTGGDNSNFLLSVQVLLDLCGTRANAAKEWAGPIKNRRLRLSIVTIAQAKAEVLACADQTVRDRLNARLADLLAKLRADGGAPLSFDEGAANVWQGFLMEPLFDDMPQIDRQFYATAVFGGLVVVEYKHAHSEALRQLGVQVHTVG